MNGLDEKWLLAIDKANKYRLTKFIFHFNGRYYFSEWINNKWTLPVIITELLL